jgi:hypothetical protein
MGNREEPWSRPYGNPLEGTLIKTIRKPSNTVLPFLSSWAGQASSLTSQNPPDWKMGRGPSSSSQEVERSRYHGWPHSKSIDVDLAWLLSSEFRWVTNGGDTSRLWEWR